MESINKELVTIIKKFPEQNNRIKTLFGINEDFRTLCSDYFLCMQYLQKFKKETGETKTCIIEFSDIRKELENELERFIFATSV